jgi:methylenetetrahydrofolate dehydrogenase (NADP+) / methenyltetrahydrofolate cyclohydrolase
MAILLDGKSLAESLETELQLRLFTRLEHVQHHGDQVPMRVPTLATILVGDNPASHKYIKMKTEACHRVGVGIVNVELPETTSRQTIFDRIDALNRLPSIHGILIQHPLPSPLRSVEHEIFDTIDPRKDVDGVTTESFGKLTTGLDGFRPATPQGILTLLSHYNICVKGLDVTIVGAGPILGKPLSLMFLKEEATVTICHRETRNLPDKIRGADIVVGAAGAPNLIKAEWIKPGAILIDAGCNPGGVGDIEKVAWKKSYAFTPHIGGVGPMTVAILLTQVYKAFCGAVT